MAQMCIVNGRIPEVASGIISFIPIFDDSTYYGKDYKISSAQILKGKFELRKKQYSDNFIAYKCRVIQDNNIFVTDFVFLKKGYQEIEITSLNEHTSPSMLTFPEIDKQSVFYKNYFKEFVQKVTRFYTFRDSCQKVNSTDSQCVNRIDQDKKLAAFQIESDSLFTSYAKIRASDYYLFWKLIERLYFKGFQEEFIPIANKVPAFLQNSLAGLKLRRDLAKIPILDLNNRVLPFSLINSRNEQVLIEPSFFKGKISLIEFWFTGCVPCLRQFEELKKMQVPSLYENFQVLSVSTDKGLMRKEWFKYFGANEKGWLQFLDNNEYLEKNLLINSFPTSYLVNESGIVIKKNISIPELQELLLQKYSKDHLYQEKGVEPQ